MLHQRISKNAYAYVFDRLRKKLSSWKASSLSFAGRITLAQSSFLSIPGYIMENSYIPALVCYEVERVCHNFIWGSSDNQRKCHLVSWEKICKPKEDGGLGFRNLRVLNRAYMMKLAWHLEKLCVKIMRAKYDFHTHVIPRCTGHSRSSHFWRVILQVWPHVEHNQLIRFFLRRVIMRLFKTLFLSLFGIGRAPKESILSCGSWLMEDCLQMMRDLTEVWQMILFVLDVFLKRKLSCICLGIVMRLGIFGLMSSVKTVGVSFFPWFVCLVGVEPEGPPYQ